MWFVFQMSIQTGLDWKYMVQVQVIMYMCIHKTWASPTHVPKNYNYYSYGGLQILWTIISEQFCYKLDSMLQKISKFDSMVLQLLSKLCLDHGNSLGQCWYYHLGTNMKLQMARPVRAWSDEFAILSGVWYYNPWLKFHSYPQNQVLLPWRPAPIYGFSPTNELQQYYPKRIHISFIWQLPMLEILRC